MERLLFAPLLFTLATVVYYCFNHGLSSSAKHQQATRMGVASFLAIIPEIIADRWLTGASAWCAAAICLIFMLAYPLLYHLANRRVSPDYDNYMDITASIYLAGIGGSLLLLAESSVWFAPAAVAAWALLLLFFIIAVVQTIYYVLYGNVFDAESVEVMLSTGINEVLEFFKSTGIVKSLAGLLIFIAAAGVMLWADLASIGSAPLEIWQQITLAVYAVAMSVMLFNGKHSPWRRLGLVSLFYEVKALRAGQAQYRQLSQERGKTMPLTMKSATTRRPSTTILVIGESANRDYMSVFSDMDRDTTPWMKANSSSPNFLFFKNAYSCAIQTVPAVRMLITEANQYGGPEFAQACSIIDVAHRMGRRVHWYSNQGHLGTFDTPVSVIAETSDVAKWTKQSLNKAQFDGTLIDFLDEVDPSVNNLIVLHLKGSHFNYLNRCPDNCRTWAKDGKGDDVTNYENSIRYTDSVLQQVWRYGKEHLGLDAMVYVSDHGENPHKRRSPRFDGFETVRIPLMVWLSDNYISEHPERYMALSENIDHCFTNDLTYELLCGIFDIESPHFNRANSLAHSTYSLTRADALTYEGRVKISNEAWQTTT